MHGRICRDVTIQASIDGKREALSGLSCRDENGQWHLTERFSTVGRPVVVAPPVQTVVVSSPHVVMTPYPYPYVSYPVASFYVYGRHGHHGGHHGGWRHRH
ncbi:MAG: hypothetical protein H7837_01990 [Magnetococcus sp. MYC-9]